MCRLYGFLSNWPRKVECELVHSQNALLAQSLSDERGLNNPDGWGLGTYTDGYPMVTKQAEAAYESEAFRWTAAQVVSTDVLAHVRKATVGRSELLNTHPFSYGSWMLVHNGNLGAFEAIRQRIIDFIGPDHAAAIEGSTDSEHVFHLLLASMERHPDRPAMEILRTGIQLVRGWSQSADPTAEVALNLMLTNGRELYGSRVDRSLWYVERREVHPCQVCGGALHVEQVPASDYRAVVVASEPITSDEDWTEVPDGSLYRLGPDVEISFEPLDQD